ncbi:alpha/beta hydrolase family protein [Lysobacter sp. D1-1-M9]|uniref:alpha/beta hydrolase family protein n=1 Tax=Novilysobacter longmucuonensis TaxID=3098603 RepID=UPI002FC78305
MNELRSLEMPLEAADGHAFTLLARLPEQPVASLLWLPALGVAARHYLPFAESLAKRGVAVFLHEWRGNGSSDLRPSRTRDWGYRQLLTLDLPTSEAAMLDALPEAAPGAARIIGGHSLGGQLACCRLALAPDTARRLWLVASGAPYWRAFPPPTRYWLPLVYRFLPWLSDRCGALPGRRIGFGGEEARSLIHDWAATALSGRYATPDGDLDLDGSMSQLAPAVRAVVLAEDWLAPASSLRFLLSKMPRARVSTVELDAQALGVSADHFGWMAQPARVAEALLD